VTISQWRLAVCRIPADREHMTGAQEPYRRKYQHTRTYKQIKTQSRHQSRHNQDHNQAIIKTYSRPLNQRTILAQQRERAKNHGFGNSTILLLPFLTYPFYPFKCGPTKLAWGFCGPQCGPRGKGVGHRGRTGGTNPG